MDTKAHLSWSVVSHINDFREMQKDWEQFFEKNPLHSPFLAWGWFNAWLTHLAGSQELRLLVARNLENELQILIPLVVKDSSRVRLDQHLTNICGHGPECSDHLGFLRLPMYDQILHELSCDGLTKCTDKGQRIQLNSLDGKQNLPFLLHRALRTQGRKARLLDQDVCPQVDLPSTWEDFSLTLSRNFRSQIRRQYKRAVQSDELTTFLAESIQYMASKDIAWMDVIENKKGIVGAALNLVHGKSVYYYMGGFDEALTKAGPGNILFVHVIKRAIAEGYTVYDFLRGAEKYKYRWGATDIPIQQLEIYPAEFWRGSVASLFDGTRIKIEQIKKAFKASDSVQKLRRIV
jgi:CelD/BcsL family acetyltransferase involved in cellulose biosynthesis